MVFPLYGNIKNTPVFLPRQFLQTFLVKLLLHPSSLLPGRSRIHGAVIYFHTDIAAAMTFPQILPDAFHILLVIFPPDQGDHVAREEFLGNQGIVPLPALFFLFQRFDFPQHMHQFLTADRL